MIIKIHYLCTDEARLKTFAWAMREKSEFIVKRNKRNTPQTRGKQALHVATFLGKRAWARIGWICLWLRRLFSERSESKATTVATVTSLRIKASIPVRLNKVHQQSERVLGLSISFALSNPNFLLVDTTTYQSRTEYLSLSLFLYSLFLFVKKKKSACGQQKQP